MQCSNTLLRPTNSDAWITIWTSRKYEDAGYTSDAFYAGIYCLLVMVFLAMSFARAFIYYHVGKLGANKVHDASFDAALKAPMHFFHVTPIGNLLAFFSKDTEVIDDMLGTFLLVDRFGTVSFAVPHSKPSFTSWPKSR
jgi:ABC-type multidrug transport system fused ATPase/permease subunit